MGAGGAEDSGTRGWRRRYTLITLCALGIFICYLDRVNISLASIAMQREFGWTETEKGHVLAAFFVGYLLTQVPGGALASRYGGKLVLGAAVLWWSLFTLLTPPAAALSVGVLIAARIALGIGEGMAFPAIYNLYGRWIPSAEKARTVVLTFGGVPLGTLSALLLTGAIIERWDWPAVFYIFGGTGFVWYVFWQRLVADTPEAHPRISAAERAEIEASAAAPEVPSQVPYRRIFSSTAVWAIIINHFCCNWGFYMLLAWLPSYFVKELGLSLRDSTWASAAPWLVMFAVSYAAGWLADAMIRRGFSVGYVRKQQQAIGLLGPAACFLLLNRVEAGETGLAIAALCGALGLLSFALSGFATNHLDIAPRYADVIMGVTNTAGTIPGIIGVAVTGYLVDVTGSFALPLLVAAGIFAFGAAVFAVFARGEKLFD